MQTCFKQYPEIYGAELQDDDDDDAAPVPAVEGEDAKPALADAHVEPETSSPQEAPAATLAAPTSAAELAPTKDVQEAVEAELPKQVAEFTEEKIKKEM
jgi:intermembrane space import and assembly protein 40